MSKYVEPKDSKQLSWKVAMKRENALPLDRSSLFTSLDDAIKYVKGEDTSKGTPYIGQIISISTDEGVSVYKVESLTENGLVDITEDAGKIKGITVNESDPITINDEGIVDISLEAENTKVTTSIPIAGGPLAELLNNAGITAITEDMTVADVFTAMFAKEEYPTPTTGATSISASVTAPTPTGNLDKNTIYEVGTEFTMNSLTSNAISTTSVASYVGNLKNGYAATLNGDVVKSNTITSVKTDGISNNTYTLSVTLTGFTASDTTALVPSTVSGPSSVTLNKSTIGYIAEGDNILSVKETGATPKVSTTAIEPVYIVSNFGNQKSDKKTIKIDAVTDLTSNTPTDSKSITIKGKFKYFLGYTDKTEYSALTSDEIRSMEVKTGFITLDKTEESTGTKYCEINRINTPFKSNGKSVVVACPSTYKLYKIAYSMGADCLSKFTSQGTVSVKTGGVYTNYNVYIYPITNNSAIEIGDVFLSRA